MKVPWKFNTTDFQKLTIVVAILFATVPMLVVANEIRTNSINLPFWDEWDQSVPLALRVAGGEAGLEDLFDQHNEHRTLTANIITAILTRFTNWDIRTSLYIGFVIVFVNLFLVIDLFRRVQRDGIAIFIVLSAFLLFSMRQKSNWLWAFQTQWFFLLFYLIASLWILKTLRVGWKAISLAALCAFLASFSLLSSIIFWPVLAIALWGRGYRQKRYFLFWGIASVLIVLFLFFEYDFNPIGQGDVTEFIFSPTVILKYFLIFLGNPFSANNTAHALSIGISGLVLLFINVLIYIKGKGALEPITIWFAFALYSIGAGLLTAVGRARIFIEFEGQPLSSRYVTTSTSFWIGLLAIIILNLTSSALKENFQSRFQK